MHTSTQPDSHHRWDWSVTLSFSGKRLDQILAQQLSDFSREKIKQWILAGQVTVDGAVVTKPNTKVAVGQCIQAAWQTVIMDLGQPQAMDLDIVFEDEHLLVVNKPVGLVVHPGAGNPDGTLLNGLLHHFADADKIARAGIVHRLDKDTSGLMVVAKSNRCQLRLIKAIKRHQVVRQYDALVYGELIAGGSVDEAIGRHPKDRIRMAVNPVNGKPALTHYRIARRLKHFTQLRCQLETGRTHQIRVHMDHLGHPLVGDATYGAGRRSLSGVDAEIRQKVKNFPHQCLHAAQLMFTHPITEQWMEFRVPMPTDMTDLIERLAAVAPENDQWCEVSFDTVPQYDETNDEQRSLRYSGEHYWDQFDWDDNDGFDDDDGEDEHVGS